jgi:hypothetical protein
MISPIPVCSCNLCLEAASDDRYAERFMLFDRLFAIPDSDD